MEQQNSHSGEDQLKKSACASRFTEKVDKAWNHYETVQKVKKQLGKLTSENTNVVAVGKQTDGEKGTTSFLYRQYIIHSVSARPLYHQCVRQLKNNS